MVFKHLRRLHGRILDSINSLFKKKNQVRLGLYGPVNSGKTTLANAICMDWIGEEVGAVSAIPHETREVQMKEHVEIAGNGKKLIFNVIDTPGIATKIDFEDFVKRGISKDKAKQRAKEATKGVIEAIKWLDEMDVVLVVMDATKDPVDQVNVTILGNLEARKVPFIIVANKLDLKNAKAWQIRKTFPQYPIIGISARTGYNMKELYKLIIETMS